MSNHQFDSYSLQPIKYTPLPSNESNSEEIKSKQQLFTQRQSFDSTEEEGEAVEFKNKQEQEEDYIPPSKRSLTAIGFIVTFLIVLLLTRNPSYYTSKSASTKSTHSTTPIINNMSIPKPKGQVSVGYFVNWGIYGRNYKPDSIPVDHLTHLLYAFANIKEDTGEVVSSDIWSDEQIHYEGDSWNEEGNNLYGNFKAIQLLKKKNRNLKVLLSIGGWTYSKSFVPATSNPSTMSNFVNSAIKLLEDYGLDGLDLDWEFPKNSVEAKNYVELLRLLREGLDNHAYSKGLAREDGYELTVAAPCGADNYSTVNIREMNQYLSFWNLMAYDYSGSWDSTANHQANLYSDPTKPNSPSTEKAIQYYLNQGIESSKLVVGIPLYGRSFLTSSGPGSTFNGVGVGSYEAGVYDYKSLPLSSSTIHYDSKLVASHIQTSTELISFDSEQVVEEKLNYIKQNKLGGAMFWELSGDQSTREQGGLVSLVKEVLGELDQRENHLNFEGSKFDNLRKGF